MKTAFTVDFAVYENGRKAPQWTIDSDINGEMTLADLLEFTRANLIIISDHALREEQSKGFDKNPIVAVDGKVGKPVANVLPLGKIEFTARAESNEALHFIYDAIIERSPVLTGAYKMANAVFLNGTQVATDLSSFRNWLASEPKMKPGDIIRFVNLVPYARKLERLGVTADRQQARLIKSRDKRQRSGEKVRAPNGVYHLSFRAALRKYRRNAKIQFKFIAGTEIGLTGADQRFRSVGGKGNGRGSVKETNTKKHRTYLYPSIIVTIGQGGTL